MYSAKITQKLREQMVRFSGELSAGLPKVVRRFVLEMIYGIQARGSVRLTEVGRALGEPISLKKTEERLSRQLGRKALERELLQRLIRQAEPRIDENTLLIVDLSDVSKKYARRMENLATVRDGSEDRLSRGYWWLNIIGTNTAGTRIVPLYGRLYSQAAEGHPSENIEIRTAMGEVIQGIGKRGTWVMDRGGDRGHLFDYLLDNRLPFLIRVRGDRGLRTLQGIQPALELARSCPMLFMEAVVKEEAIGERPLKVFCGLRRVRLPKRREELTLVVAKGFGQEPLMILTNVPVRRSRKSIWRIVRSYVTRWRIEDVNRFIKQSYRLEDVRCLSYRRLQALMVLVTIAAFFAAVYLGLRMKLRVLAGHMLRVSKRVFGIPDFRLYALADGIRQCLYSQTKGVKRYLEEISPPQLQPKLLFP